MTFGPGKAGIIKCAENVSCCKTEVDILVAANTTASRLKVFPAAFKCLRQYTETVVYKSFQRIKSSTTAAVWITVKFLFNMLKSSMHVTYKIVRFIIHMIIFALLLYADIAKKIFGDYSRYLCSKVCPLKVEAEGWYQYLMVFFRAVPSPDDGQYMCCGGYNNETIRHTLEITILFLTMFTSAALLFTIYLSNRWSVKKKEI